jgi:dihydroorotase
LAEKQALFAEHSLVNYACYFGATNTNTALFSRLDTHRVPGIKLFMGSSTGDMLVDKRDSLERVFGESPLLIAAHCEDTDIIRANQAIYASAFQREDGDIPRAFHALIRSVEACYNSTATAIELATRHNARLHVLHLSTVKELTLFSQGKVSEKRITAEACIPHLILDPKEQPKESIFPMKCNPAVKTTFDRYMIHVAVRQNIIDTIATDHAPHLYSEKRGGAVKALSGIPSIQFSLPMMVNLFNMRIAVQKMCHAPALLYGIRDRGFIRQGYKADLVLLGRGGVPANNEEFIYSKCGWSLFNKRHFLPVMMTFVNGHCVYRRKHELTPFDARKRGEPLYFE